MGKGRKETDDGRKVFFKETARARARGRASVRATNDWLGADRLVRMARWLALGPAWRQGEPVAGLAATRRRRAV